MGIIGRGFLASSLVTSITVIALHHVSTRFKHISLLRFGLTFFFFLTVTLFIAGQISALTFTAVSDDCTARNTLALVADTLARVSALIIGLNVFARARFRWARYSLFGWAVLRISKPLLQDNLLMVVVGSVAAAHIFNDLGVVCLIGTKTVPMALGMTLDLLLDIFLIFRAYHLLRRADEDTRLSERIVFATTIALIVWHLVARPEMVIDRRVAFPYTSESALLVHALFHIASFLAFSRVSHPIYQSDM